MDQNFIKVLEECITRMRAAFVHVHFVGAVSRPWTLLSKPALDAEQALKTYLMFAQNMLEDEVAHQEPTNASK